VDRKKLQPLLRHKFFTRGGSFITAKLNAKTIAPNLFDNNVLHDAKGTELTLSDGTTLRYRITAYASL
jgi:hypothetical protein